MISRNHVVSALVGSLLVASALTACSGSADDSVVGKWGEETQGKPSLTFADDGTVAGTDGCNQLSGSWTQDGSTISIPPMASTLMACEDVDTWLLGIASATISGDTLTVLDQDGTTIGTLDRAK